MLESSNSDGVDYNLMEKANPLLFSKDVLEKYPFEYDELKQFLTAKDINGPGVSFEQKPHNWTEGDYVDFLLYGSESGGSIDLKKKLASEYALYQVQKQKKNGGLPGGKDLPIEDVMKLEPKSTEWYQQMMALLEDVNGIELNTNGLMTESSNANTTLHMSSRNASVLDIAANKSQIIANDDIQEITSYLLSNAIKKGIELKPKRVDDPVEFLKSCVEIIIGKCNNNDNIINEMRKHSIKRSNTYKTSKELETAFNDLQLAYNFLTKKFENDREEYTRDIEKLTSNNRELQNKVLNYHSTIISMENKLKKNIKLPENYAPTSASSTAQSNSSLSTPDGSTTATANGLNSQSSSISIMTGEFKKLLAETQKGYEEQLDKERKLRLKLEQQLKDQNK